MCIRRTSGRDREVSSRYAESGRAVGTGRVVWSGSEGRRARLVSVERADFGGHTLLLYSPPLHGLLRQATYRQFDLWILVFRSTYISDDLWGFLGGVESVFLPVT